MDFGGDITVKLLGRRPDKLQGYVDRGAEVAVGQDDVDYLVNATRGVDTLFWATPPGYGSDDVRAFQNRLGKAAATAIGANKIPRVVNLSSVGRRNDTGVGPINGLHNVEVLLNRRGRDITHLRPGFFFENLLWQVDSIRKWGRISLPLSGTRNYPMIATRDIGRVAAAAGQQRLDRAQRAGVTRAGRLTFKEVAQTLWDVLGRKIVYIKCDPQEMRRLHAQRRHEPKCRRPIWRCPTPWRPESCGRCSRAAMIRPPRPPWPSSLGRSCPPMIAQPVSPMRET